MMKKFVFALVAVLPLFSQTAIEPRIDSETLPAGATMQLKLGTTSPNPIIIGQFEMDFGFESISGASVHSPTGDAYGVVLRTGNRFTASFISPSGSMGTQLDYPFFTLTGPIPSNLPVGTIVPLNFGGGTFFTAPGGVPYIFPAAKPGELTIGGSLSISNVIPGGGAQASGQEIRLLGTGFDADTEIDVHDTLITNVRAISSTEIRFNLAQAADMTGARVRVRSRIPNGRSEVTYFSYARTAALGVSSRPLLVAAYPLFSRSTFRSAILSGGQTVRNGFTAVALENASTSAVQVELELISGGAVTGQASVVLPPYSKWIRTVEEAFNATGGANSQIRINASAPIGVLGLLGNEDNGTISAFAPTAATTTPTNPGPPVNPGPPADPGRPVNPGPPPLAGPPGRTELLLDETSISMTYRVGDNEPEADIKIKGDGGPPVDVRASSNASWLVATLDRTRTPTKLTLKTQPAGLQAGSHTAQVTIVSSEGASAILPITLTVRSDSARNPKITSLVSAATQLSSEDLAPGELATIYGAGLDDGGEVEVWVGIQRALIVEKSQTQIAFVVPEMDAQVEVPVYIKRGDGHFSEARTIRVEDSSH